MRTYYHTVGEASAYTIVTAIQISISELFYDPGHKVTRDKGNENKPKETCYNSQ